jgi:quercetin dioxygenase-like cupin family protein
MQPNRSEIIHGVRQGTNRPVLNVLGPTVEFLTPPGDAPNGVCVMRGVLPAGVTVPLHSHDDTEDFYVLAGSQQVLVHENNGFEWCDANAGDYVRVPGGVLHAHRNVSDEPAIDLIFTTGQLGRFFEEVGRPLTGPPQAPSPQQVAEFVAAATKYGHTLGTPEENAAAGIQLSSGGPE